MAVKHIGLGFLLLVLAGCGGGGSSSSGGTGGGGGNADDSDRPIPVAPPEPTETGVSGRITAPNGETPIAGVTVYLGSEGSGQMLLAAQTSGTSESLQNCTPPDGEGAIWACTDDYGYFVLELGELEPIPETLMLGFVRGKWRGEASIDGLGHYVGVLPFPSEPAAGAPRIAVITGSFDQIENALVRLGMTENPAGSAQLVASAPLTSHSHSQHHASAMAVMTDVDLCDPSAEPPEWWPPQEPWPPAWCEELAPPEWLGSETFDLYIGSREYGEDGDVYPNMEVLFQLGDGGTPRLLDYDILYVNCDAPTPSELNWEQMLEHFVEQGSRLYVTDLSSEWVSMPFHGYVVTSLDEGAYTGEQVRVVDAGLRSWLRGMPCGDGAACVDSSGLFALTGYGEDVLEPLDDAVTTLVRGNNDEQALTLRFPHGNEDGQVFFSTFHTADQFFGDGSATAEERILQYLFYSD